LSEWLANATDDELMTSVNSGELDSLGCFFYVETVSLLSLISWN